MPSAVRRFLCLTYAVALHLPAPGGAVDPPPPPTPFADALRYAPAYPLPSGWAYNAATGLAERTGAAWERVPGQGTRSIDPAAYQYVVPLTATADTAANHAALQAACDATLDRADDTLILLDGSIAHAWTNGHQVVHRARTNGATGRLVIAFARLDPAHPSHAAYPRDLDARLRHDLGDHASLPKFYARGGQPAIYFEPGADHVAYVGVDVTYAPDVDTGSHLTAGSTAQFSGFIAAALDYVAQQLPAGQYPDRIALRHVAVHGAPLKASRRGLRMNTRRFALGKCAVWDIGAFQPDCQAFNALAGPGGYLLDDSFLEAAWGETAMFGGASNGASRAAQIAHVVVVGCTLSYSVAVWDPDGAESKNLLEFKCCDTALVQGCRFVGYRGRGRYQGQFFGIVVKYTNDDAVTWGATCRITIRGNRLTDCRGYLGVSGAARFPAEDAGCFDVEVAHNVADDPGPEDGVGQLYTMQIGYEGAEVPGLRIHHNTFGGLHRTDEGPGFLSDVSNGALYDRLGFYGNLLLATPGAWLASYVRAGASLPARSWMAGMLAAARLPNLRWQRNVLVAAAADPAAMIAGDLAWTARAALLLTAGLAPAAGSPLWTLDADGGLVGADPRLVPA